MQRRVLVREIGAGHDPEDQEEDQGRHQRELDQRRTLLVATVTLEVGAESHHPMSDSAPPPGNEYGLPRIVMLVAPSVLKSSTTAVPLRVNKPLDCVGPLAGAHPAPKPVWRVPP